MPTPTAPETPALQGLVASSIGVFLIGSFLSVCLFGVNSLQAWLYYQHYPTDTAGMKATVAWVWILDTVHAIFLGHGVYFHVIRGFGRGHTGHPRVEHLAGDIVVLMSPESTIIATAFLTITLRVFFAWRIYIYISVYMSARKRLIAGVIFVLSVSTMAASFAISGITLSLDSYAKIMRSTRLLATVTLALGATIDLAIARSQGYYLHHARSGMPRSDKLVNSLIFWAVNVGVLTSVADLAVMTLTTVPQVT